MQKLIREKQMKPLTVNKFQIKILVVAVDMIICQENKSRRSSRMWKLTTKSNRS